MSTGEAKEIVRLTRLLPFKGICLFGQLDTDVGMSLGYTLEPPWLSNEAHQSCLPAGVYSVKPYDSPTKGKVFRLNDKDTRPRVAIEIHKGNVPSQTQGCILLGMKCGLLVIEDKTEPAVLNSKRAMEDLLHLYPKGFTLHIDDRT